MDTSLLSGWSVPEPDGARRFVWSNGASSLANFDIDAVASMQLELRCRPFQYTGSAQQHLLVGLNGERVGDIALHSGDDDYVLPLPIDRVRRGRNTVSFDYAWTAEPADVVPGSTDRRRIAVAFEWIRIARTGPQLEPVLIRARDGADAPALIQRESGAFSYLLFLPERAALAAMWRAPGNDRPVSLRIEIEDDDSNETLVSEEVPADAGNAERRIDLSRWTGRAVRLRFEVAGLAPGSEWTWTRLAIDPATHGKDDTTPGFAAARPGLNVVLVVLDASNRSRYGIYGSDRQTTPNIDALAAEGLVFDQAHAQAPYTLASTVSLFTSRLPSEHAVVEKTDRLGTDLPTLAETLRDAGYATAAWSGNLFVARSFGLDRGFETFAELYKDKPRGQVTLANDFDAPVSAWLRGLASGTDLGRPFFAYLHLVQPHEPYNVAPSEFYRDLDDGYQGPVDGGVKSMYEIYEGALRPDARDVERIRQLYDGNLRFADAAVGRLVALLGELGLSERTLIVVTADHGEALGEHGLFGHNVSVDESMTSIPMVVRFPRDFGLAGRVEDPMASIDLGPLILEAVGLPVPESFRGRNPLRSYTDGGANAPFVFSRSAAMGGAAQIAVWSRDFKYVYDGQTQQRELFTGPEFRAGEGLAATHPVTMAFFDANRRAFESRLREGRAERIGSLTPAERDGLKALGYLVE